MSINNETETSKKQSESYIHIARKVFLISLSINILITLLIGIKIIIVNNTTREEAQRVSKIEKNAMEQRKRAIREATEKQRKENARQAELLRNQKEIDELTNSASKQVNLQYIKILKSYLSSLPSSDNAFVLNSSAPGMLATFVGLNRLQIGKTAQYTYNESIAGKNHKIQGQMVFREGIIEYSDDYQKTSKGIRSNGEVRIISGKNNNLKIEFITTENIGEFSELGRAKIFIIRSTQ